MLNNNPSTNEFEFANRIHKIIKFLNNQRAEIVCLQEIKPYTDHVSGYLTGYDVAMLLSSECNMTIANLLTLDPNPNSFANLILYNSAKVFPTQQHTEWLPRIEMYGHPNYKHLLGMQVIKFSILEKEDLIDERYTQNFWVCNSHFGITPEENTYSANVCVKSLQNIRESIIIGGTLGECSQAISILNNYFKCLTTHINTTFVPFNGEDNSSLHKKIDHCFAYGDTNYSTCSAIDTLVNRESEHFMMLVTYNYKRNLTAEEINQIIYGLNIDKFMNACRLNTLIYQEITSVLENIKLHLEKTMLSYVHIPNIISINQKILDKYMSRIIQKYSTNSL